LLYIHFFTATIQCKSKTKQKHILVAPTLLNPFRGKLTYMSPKVKGYTDRYVILTYTGTEKHVSFWLFIPEIHFFGQGLKLFFTSKRVKSSLSEVSHKLKRQLSQCHSLGDSYHNVTVWVTVIKMSQSG